MNKTILALLIFTGVTVHAQTDTAILQRIDVRVMQLSDKLDRNVSETQRLEGHVDSLQACNRQLSLQITGLKAASDSADDVLMSGVTSNTALANSHNASATEKIKDVATTSHTALQRVTTWGIWAIVALLAIAIVIYVILHRGITRGSDAIMAIRTAQSNLEEESVKLDTRLVELLDKQMEWEKWRDSSSPTSTPQASRPDHSLALKVADEITRIEKNLLRMDPNVKGYKALVKAIERIKDNFKANGYEIVTYMGQPYKEGMRINPDFVIDETLSPGTRTITSVSKPQVHFNGELIQKATVTVSQNI